ncbi:MAG: methylmalonyl-CoA mutase family protein [Bacteroidota bacterium]|nr:methylmalonyl-CoA mutase family protein [Bacteroidota bacterium]
MSAEEKEKGQSFLFEEFEAVTKKRWLDLVKEDLKGADFDRKLVWQSYEGFSVQPMYFREDMEKLAHLGTLPGFTPYLRGSRKAGSGAQTWSISQTHDASEHDTLLEEIRLAVTGGQRRVGLRFHPVLREAQDVQSMHNAPAGGVWITSSDAFGALCASMPAVDGIDLYAGLSSPMFTAAAADAKLKGMHAHYDPVTMLATSSSLPWTLETAFRLMADGIRFATDELPDSTVVGISGEPWHNAGGSAVEEIACVLATGVEYLQQLQQRGVEVKRASRFMRFTFPVGSTFFMEIAKLRAIRALWTRIVEEFEAGASAAAPMHMHVCGSRWSKTVYDPYVNMLRSTVQAMAGAIGGAESVDIAPFDDVAGNPGVFSRRIARNVQIILQEEARLSQVSDAAAGSYYVEQLTDSIMRHAWSMFREIETRGGIVSALKDGYIQQRLGDTADRKRENISRRRDVIVGTNKYPNLSEKALPAAGKAPTANTTLQERYHSLLEERGDAAAARAAFIAAVEDENANLVASMRDALAAGMTIPELHAVLRAAETDTFTVEAIPVFRAAEQFEAMRAAVERCEKKPRVFLATYGAVNWSRARATFASGFFGATGMEIVDNLGFPSATAAAEAAIEQDADIVVACSEDEMYRETIPDIMDSLRASPRPMLLIVAGNPVDDLSALREAGVHAFIHVKADAGSILAGIIQTLGIEIQ